MPGLLAMAAICAVTAHPGQLSRDSTHWGGPPPKRFQHETTLTVTTLTAEGIASTCNVDGPPPCPLYTLACTIGDHSYLPNPCDAKYAGEAFAAVACHEFGHRQGWPGTHGP